MRRISMLIALPLLIAALGLFSVPSFAQNADPIVATSATSRPAAQATPAQHKVKLDKPFRSWGIGVKISTLGAGVEVATPVTWKSNLRLGFNDFTYSASNLNFSQDQIDLNSAKLTLRSFTANYDFFLIGPLHISPGVLLYNDNHMSATAAPAPGTIFTLNNQPYVINTTGQLSGTANLQFGTRVAPEFLIGLGNMVPRGNHHFSVHFEFGAVYQGVPRATLNFLGQVCPTVNGIAQPCISATDPTVQANIQAEQTKFNTNSTLQIFKFYPVVSFGLSYKIL